MLHVKVRREDLARAASLTSSVAPKRTTMPILANVLLDAEGDRLLVAASDLEISHKISIPADVIEPGRVTAPAKTFNDIVKSLAHDQVIVQETANHSIIVSCGSFSGNLFGLSPENFPNLPGVDDASALVPVDAKLLADAIVKTISSVAQSDDTYNLSGVCLLKEVSPEDGVARLRLVSTDTQRLTVATVPVDEIDRLDLNENGVIVPIKGLQELKSLAESPVLVELGLSDQNLVVRSEMSELSVRLLEGPFPMYQKIVPVGNDLLAWFDRKDLLDAIRRVAILVSGRFPTAKFDFSNDLLTISVTNPELGKAEEAVGLEYSGPAIVTGFNPGFYLEILSSMASDKVQLAMKEDRPSFLITGPEDPGYLAVVVSASLAE